MRQNNKCLYTSLAFNRIGESNLLVDKKCNKQLLFDSENDENHLVVDKSVADVHLKCQTLKQTQRKDSNLKSSNQNTDKLFSIKSNNPEYFLDTYSIIRMLCIRIVLIGVFTLSFIKIKDISFFVASNRMVYAMNTFLLFSTLLALFKIIKIKNFLFCINTVKNAIEFSYLAFIELKLKFTYFLSTLKKALASFLRYLFCIKNSIKYSRQTTKSKISRKQNVIVKNSESNKKYLRNKGLNSKNLTIIQRLIQVLSKQRYLKLLQNSLKFLSKTYRFVKSLIKLAYKQSIPMLYQFFFNIKKLFINKARAFYRALNCTKSMLKVSLILFTFFFVVLKVNNCLKNEEPETIFFIFTFCQVLYCIDSVKSSILDTHKYSTLKVFKRDETISLEEGMQIPFIKKTQKIGKEKMGSQSHENPDSFNGINSTDTPSSSVNLNQKNNINNLSKTTDVERSNLDKELSFVGLNNVNLIKSYLIYKKLCFYLKDLFAKVFHFNKISEILKGGNCKSKFINNGKSYEVQYSFIQQKDNGYISKFFTVFGFFTLFSRVDTKVEILILYLFAFLLYVVVPNIIEYFDIHRNKYLFSILMLVSFYLIYIVDPEFFCTFMYIFFSISVFLNKTALLLEQEICDF